MGLATLCCSPPALLEAETLILPTQLQVEHLKTQLQCCVAAALATSDTFSVAGVDELMRLGDTSAGCAAGGSGGGGRYQLLDPGDDRCVCPDGAPLQQCPFP